MKALNACFEVSTTRVLHYLHVFIRSSIVLVNVRHAQHVRFTR